MLLSHGSSKASGEAQRDSFPSHGPAWHRSIYGPQEEAAQILEAPYPEHGVRGHQVMKAKVEKATAWGHTIDIRRPSFKRNVNIPKSGNDRGKKKGA